MSMKLLSLVFVVTAATLSAVYATRYPSIFLDGDAIKDEYDTVRNTEENIIWLTIEYAGRKLELGTTGSNYNSFLAQLAYTNCVYGYVRFMMSDASYKYAFITWVGPAVNPLKKARISTDKAFVKTILADYNKEILADEKSDVAEDRVRNLLSKARKKKFKN